MGTEMSFQKKEHGCGDAEFERMQSVWRQNQAMSAINVFLDALAVKSPGAVPRKLYEYLNSDAFSRRCSDDFGGVSAVLARKMSPATLSSCIQQMQRDILKGKATGETTQQPSSASTAAERNDFSTERRVEAWVGAFELKSGSGRTADGARASSSRLSSSSGETKAGENDQDDEAHTPLGGYVSMARTFILANVTAIMLELQEKKPLPDTEWVVAAPQEQSSGPRSTDLWDVLNYHKDRMFLRNAKAEKKGSKSHSSSSGGKAGHLSHQSVGGSSFEEDDDEEEEDLDMDDDDEEELDLDTVIEKETGGEENEDGGEGEGEEQEEGQDSKEEAGGATKKRSNPLDALMASGPAAVAGLVLEVEGAKRYRGAGALLVRKSGSRHQRWTHDGKGRLVPTHCNFIALDVEEGVAEAETRLVVWNIKIPKDSCQVWRLTSDGTLALKAPAAYSGEVLVAGTALDPDGGGNSGGGDEDGGGGGASSSSSAPISLVLVPASSERAIRWSWVSSRSGKSAPSRRHGPSSGSKKAPGEVDGAHKAHGGAMVPQRSSGESTSGASDASSVSGTLTPRSAGRRGDQAGRFEVDPDAVAPSSPPSQSSSENSRSSTPQRPPPRIHRPSPR